jgi:feruloyl esterase
MKRVWPGCAVAFVVAAVFPPGPSGEAWQSSALPDIGARLTIGEADCSAAKVGTAIPRTKIGELVSGVTLAAPVWSPGSGGSAGYCTVEGSMAPLSADAKPINFRIALPASWTLRAIQLGGGGMNGVIPNVTGGRGGVGPAQGIVTYGSDSGHRAADPPEWALSDEAIKNLGYMQMKKTHDAAMEIVERVYGRRPQVKYYVGTSQGGREALTVAQRYPADYDGIVANVPIVGFSSLMLAPEWIRIHEKPASRWVPRPKIETIRAEFLRQCDHRDGLVDGIINNYQECRRIFDVAMPPAGRSPWAARRCPDDTDPDPADTSSRACLTDGQISTLERVYSRYRFAAPLANRATTFGMWLPNTDPGGSGLIVERRFRGQEGAAADAPMHAHLGILGVTGFLMRDVRANPLDYVEGGPLQARRAELSAWLDATDPDLSRFAARGGKMIVTIGTDDTLASPGEQLDYYQAVLDTLGRERVDAFARLFVMPQANHGLSGRNHGVDGEGRTIPVAPIPNAFDRVRLLLDWVERGTAPGKSVVVTAGDKSLPLCSYPEYPRYLEGPAAAAASYRCSQ